MLTNLVLPRKRAFIFYTPEEVFIVMDDRKNIDVPDLILAAGEPLMHPDKFAISRHARDVGLCVGISIDSMRDTHDKFRRRQGSFDEAPRGIRMCRGAGINVALRFTLTQGNRQDLPGLPRLMHDEHVNKFYLSHLNYVGRGRKNRRTDLQYQMTREAMELLFSSCWQDVQDGRRRKFVTGNNDADGVYLLLWAIRYILKHVGYIGSRLTLWGGNSSSVNVSNVDKFGNIDPDTVWWDYIIVNAKQCRFSKIWLHTLDRLMADLKLESHPVENRCASCQSHRIYGDNPRTCAWQLTANFWAENPGCYRNNDEIGIETNQELLQATPWKRQSIESASPLVC